MRLLKVKFTEAVVWKCSVKEVVLEKFTEKNMC